MSGLFFWLGLACVVLAIACLFNDKLGLSGVIQKIGVRGEHGRRFTALGLAMAGFLLFHLSG